MSMRNEVLQCFKSLHNARKTVFKGDNFALNEARKKINEEFKTNKHITDIEGIQELINKSRAVETELRTCVIQAKEIEPGVFKAELRQETLKLDNTPYNEELVNKKCSQKLEKNSCGKQ